MNYVGLLLLTGGGLILHIPTFSTICLMLQMKALGFWNSSRVGSNTGASGGGLNTSWESGIFKPHTYATDLQNYSGYDWFVSGVFNLAWLLQLLVDNYSNFFVNFLVEFSLSQNAYCAKNMMAIKSVFIPYFSH